MKKPFIPRNRIADGFVEILVEVYDNSGKRVYAYSNGAGSEKDIDKNIEMAWKMAERSFPAENLTHIKIFYRIG